VAAAVEADATAVVDAEVEAGATAMAAASDIGLVYEFYYKYNKISGFYQFW
jgi:hypothetical protein